jgi:hypothetical protein
LWPTPVGENTVAPGVNEEFWPVSITQDANMKRTGERDVLAGTKKTHKSSKEIESREKSIDRGLCKAIFPLWRFAKQIAYICVQFGMDEILGLNSAVRLNGKPGNLAPSGRYKVAVFM